MVKVVPLTPLLAFFPDSELNICWLGSISLNQITIWEVRSRQIKCAGLALGLAHIRAPATVHDEIRDDPGTDSAKFYTKLAKTIIDSFSSVRSFTQQKFGVLACFCPFIMRVRPDIFIFNLLKTVIRANFVDNKNYFYQLFQVAITLTL